MKKLVRKLIKESVRFIIRFIFVMTIMLAPFYLLALVEKYTILQIFLYIIIAIMIVVETKNIIEGE